MFTIEIAKIKIAINNKFDFVENNCKDYIVNTDCFDFSVNVTDDEFIAEKDLSGDIFSDGFIESVCIYRSIARELPKYDAFVLHCASIEKDGFAYCFTAKSGVGKTTHAMLWKKAFPDTSFINGDKPIIRFFNDKPYVCGTPWGGKENLHSNVMVPLRSLCFIERSINNAISRICSHDALKLVLHQIFIPDDVDLAYKTLDLLGKVLSNTSLWQLNCNTSDDAPLLSYEAMSKEE